MGNSEAHQGVRVLAIFVSEIVMLEVVCFKLLCFNVVCLKLSCKKCCALRFRVTSGEFRGS